MEGQGTYLEIIHVPSAKPGPFPTPILFFGAWLNAVWQLSSEPQLTTVWTELRLIILQQCSSQPEQFCPSREHLEISRDIVTTGGKTSEELMPLASNGEKHRTAPPNLLPPQKKKLYVAQ